MKDALRAKNADAAETLGGYYFKGENTRRDYVLAYAMYNLVLEFGQEYQKRRIRYKLQDLEKNLSPADLSEAQKISGELSGGFWDFFIEWE